MKTTSLVLVVLVFVAAVERPLAFGEVEQAAPLVTPLKADNLDSAAFVQWIDGVEKPMPQRDGPRHVAWTTDAQPEWDGVLFGDSKIPGPRHLRIGVKTPITVGSVLVRAGGQVSMLRPKAPYPGDLADESQWMPARCIVRSPAADPKTADEQYVLWVFPKAAQTRALRFTHTAGPADNRFAGWLGGAYVFSQRMANVAPGAMAASDVNGEAVARINDESNNGTWSAWDNGPEGGPRPVSPRYPVDILLAWPQPIAVRALGALWAGFAAAEVQTFEGPVDRPPREAAETDWRTVARWEGLENQYPRGLGVNWLDLGHTLTTRAIRLRITQATKESHPHLEGKTKGGRRVWLGELLALHPLGDTPLETSLPPQPPAAILHGPIPIRFTLDTPGYVTLVIESVDGRRVRNLVSETPFPAGLNTVWWDATDDLARDTDAARHGVYHIPTRLVAPGDYRVRGLYHAGIDLRYVFSIYNAGSPAWSTEDHTGGWLTNHTPPSSALFVPADKTPGGGPLVYLGSYVSEGGDGLAWVDQEGHKRGGVGWVGGAWIGAPYLARDAGPQAVDGVYVYAGSAWESELRLTAVTRSGDKPVIKFAFRGGKDASVLSGLAINKGLLVCSLPKQNEMLLIDAKAGKFVATVSLRDPRGLAFDSQGRLLALAGKQLHRYRLPAAVDKRRLPAPEILVTSGLEDPQHVALDARGNLYVSDRGNSHQIKVFDPAGKPLRVIGTAGAPTAGPYDPLHMNNPNGLTIDDKGHLWVAETDFQPKRVSVWTLDGRLVRAFYGPSEYGGGGRLDPMDKSRFYFHGMEFQLDWRRGVDRLVQVFFRPGAGDLGLPNGFGVDGQPEMPLYRTTASGVRRYFTNCYNSNPTNGASVAMLWLDRQGVAVPVAALGRANDWSLLKSDAFKPRLPAGVEVRNGSLSTDLLFAWSDRNGDGQVQPEEVTFLKASSGGVTVMPDLSVVVSRVDSRAVRYVPQRYTAADVPIYDLAVAETLVEGAQAPTSSGGDQALVDPSGWTILTVAPNPFAPQSLGGAYRGQPRWSYPDLWPGLHASHESPPPDRPGELIGTTRLLGGFVTPRAGDAGPLWTVNGNQGNIYLFTADGLFVAELFHDIRRGRSWAMPMAQRGMRLNDLSLHDENFWPSITQTGDGEIYLVDGARTSLVRVEGLEQIHRLSETSLHIGPQDLKSAQEYLLQGELQRQRAQGRPTLRVPLRRIAPAVDGKLDDWANATWATVDKSGVAAFFDSNSKPYNITATVAVAGDRLYAAFRTGDAKLLENSGETPLAPFKSGGGLDLMIAADRHADDARQNAVQGDLRLLVTLVRGKPRGLIYRPVVPGTKEPVSFSSPWRTITIDRVDDVSDQLQFASADGNFELSVPLAVLGLKPESGQTIRADLGVLRGNGFQTLHRVYWGNKATGITSDVPSEAMLVPSLWGRWVFHEEQYATVRSRLQLGKKL
ncbi:MAG: hypothetical protein ABSG53_02085 [Thermoguttaceae bacterium]